MIVLPFERNPRRLARAIASSDLFVHAGDIGDAHILQALAELAPLTAVRGNQRVTVAC